LRREKHKIGSGGLSAGFKALDCGTVESWQIRSEDPTDIAKLQNEPQRGLAITAEQGK